MWKEDLELKGWVEVDNIHSTDELFEIAETVGDVVRHPDGQLLNIIVPKKRSNAVSGTFSAKHGLDGFPLHTDTAFWPLPTRYIILMVDGNTENGTLVVPISLVFSRLDKFTINAANKSISIVNIPSGQHYCSTVFREGNESGFRYDSCSMVPANESAKVFNKVFTNTLNEIKPKEIMWTGRNALIIDNWKTLHGRSAISRYSKKRKLNRIYLR